MASLPPLLIDVPRNAAVAVGLVSFPVAHRVHKRMYADECYRSAYRGSVLRPDLTTPGMAAFGAQRGDWLPYQEWSTQCRLAPLQVSREAAC